MIITITYFAATGISQRNAQIPSPITDADLRLFVEEFENREALIDTIHHGPHCLYRSSIQRSDLSS